MLSAQAKNFLKKKLGGKKKKKKTPPPPPPPPPSYEVFVRKRIVAFVV